MSEILWPEEPTRAGGDPPPGCVGGGEGGDFAVFLIAPDDLRREHQAKIAHRFALDWVGSELDQAAAWAIRRPGLRRIQVLADPQSLLSIPGFRSQPLVELGEAFAVRDAQCTWLARTPLDVFRAPRKLKASIFALTPEAAGTLRWRGPI